MILDRTSLAAACTTLLLLPVHAYAQPSAPPEAPRAPARKQAEPPRQEPEASGAGRSLAVAATEVTPSTVPTEQMLEVTGGLSIRVEKIEDAITSLEAMLPEIGGRLHHRNDRTISFEVDRARFPEAMNRAAKLGVELDRSVEMQDRTPAFLETLALLRSAQDTRNRIGELHHRITGITGVKDPIRVESALSDWDNRIAELKRTLQQIQRRTHDAVVRIQLHPVQGAIEEQIPSFQLPFPWLADLSLERLLDLESRTTPDHDTRAETIEAGAQMDFHLMAYRATEEIPLGGNKSAVSAGLTMRGVGDTTPIGFAAGMDLELGGGVSGGFLYDYRMVAGLGTGIDQYVAIGAVTGFGIGGLTGDHIPFGLDIPVELFAAVEIGDIMRASTWARSSWIVASDARQDGSNTAPFGDEFAAGGSLLFGERRGSYSHERAGLTINGAYRELMGTSIYQVSLGIGTSFLEFDRP